MPSGGRDESGDGPGRRCAFPVRRASVARDDDDFGSGGASSPSNSKHRLFIFMHDVFMQQNHASRADVTLLSILQVTFQVTTATIYGLYVAAV